MNGTYAVFVWISHKHHTRTFIHSVQMIKCNVNFLWAIGFYTCAVLVLVRFFFFFLLLCIPWQLPWADSKCYVCSIVEQIVAYHHCTYTMWKIITTKQDNKKNGREWKKKSIRTTHHVYASVNRGECIELETALTRYPLVTIVF